jgi:hypothetical protein
MSDAIRNPWSPLARATAVVAAVCTVGSIVMVGLFVVVR